jgi:hypothetical protein
MIALSATTETPTELEPDNSTRLTVFDAVSDAMEAGENALTLDELHVRVIGRLNHLVGRELHIAGEKAYVAQKVDRYVADGILARVEDDGEVRYTLAEDPQVFIRYPDGSCRRYTHGLIRAREQLDAVNAALRNARYDVTEHLPHLRDDDPDFIALVRSIEEHGFLQQSRILRYDDGKIIDGVSRERAAIEAGTSAKYLDVDRLHKPLPTKIKRQDTPLTRVRLALDLNAGRLSDEQRQEVLDKVAAVVGRAWTAIQDDLDLTREWRLAVSRAAAYTPDFEVVETTPPTGTGAPVLITPEQKIGARSLLRAFGLKEYDASKTLPTYVEMERARPILMVGGKSKAQPKQDFAPAAALSLGIRVMLGERRRPRDRTEWERAAAWLEELSDA